MKGVKFLALALGVIIYGLLFFKIGVTAVLDQISLLRWNLLFIVILQVLSHGVNASAWSLTLGEERSLFHFRRFFLARLAGEAVNYITPSAYLGGEPLKAYLIKDMLPLPRGMATVIVAKTTHIVSEAIFVFLGVFLSFSQLTLPPHLKISMIVVLLLTIPVLAFLLISQQAGGFSFAIRLLARFKIDRGYLAQTADEVKKMEENLEQFYKRDKRRFFLSTLLSFLGWMVGVLEIFFIIWFLGGPPDLLTAMIIETMAQIVTALTFFVPGKIGTLEGGQALIFALLGMNMTMGFSLGIIRRIRELIWVGLGLLVIAMHR
ncbi:MAG: flippase-like domain-containing protein [Candidatus Tectomicrobia bacterium]|nr:flippase-like domain-containing protein [Candidatus Tectomicrobia bacterium]